MFLCLFSSNIMKVNHFLYLNFSFCMLINSALHTFSALVSYGYDVIPSSLIPSCNLLSSLLLSEVLLTFSMNTLRTSLLNLCCDLNILSWFFRQLLQSLNSILLFIIPFLFPLPSYQLSHHLSNNYTPLIFI